MNSGNREGKKAQSFQAALKLELEDELAKV